MEEDFGLYDLDYYNGLSVEENNALLAGRNKAAASGNEKLKNVFDIVLKFGAKALVLLSSAGVIGNGNRSAFQLSDGSYSEARLEQLLAANGGTLPNPDLANSTTPSSTFLGLSTNTILLIAAIAAGFYLLKSDKKKKK